MLCGFADRVARDATAIEVDRLQREWPDEGATVPLRDVVGHAGPAARIRVALLGSRPAHAYLFVGPDGVGKGLFALETARLLLCESPVDEDACGVCRACRQVTRGSHPDLHLVEAPEGKRFISLEQIHGLCERYGIRPHGERRIAVLRDADSMTPEAANALLKTLEEPPSWGLLILTTSRPGGLPETVLSRCQTLRFGPLSRDEVAEILRGQEGWDASAIAFAAAFSDGSVGRAAELRRIGGVELRDALHDRLGALRMSDNFDLTEFALERVNDLGRSLEQKRGGLRTIFGLILRRYRDILALRLGVSDDRLFNADRASELRDEAARLTEPGLEAAIETTLQACDHLNRNANLNLLLQQYFFNLAEAVGG